MTMRLLVNRIRAHGTACAWAALVVYGLLIGWQYPPIAAGSDAGGYFFSARLLMQGEIATELRTLSEMDPGSFWENLPLGGISEDGSTSLKPTYPVGMPAHFALLGHVVGLEWAARIVAVLTACGSVWLMFLLLRLVGIGVELDVAGAVALAVSPQFVFSSVSPMSDTVATFWVLLAFVGAYRARASWPWGLVCGVALGVAVAVRPSNALALPALCVLIASWRGLAAATLGGVPFAVVLALYQKAQYGSALKTGYGDVWGIFGTHELVPNLLHYLEWMPFVLPVGCLAVCAWWYPWRSRAREVVAMVLLGGVFFGFYAFYKHTHDAWWFLRFVQPAFPALIVLGCMVLDQITKGRTWSPGRAWRVGLPLAAASVVVVASAVEGFWQMSRRHVFLVKGYHQPYRSVTTWANANLPANAAIATMQMSMTFYYYTDHPVLRWDTISPERFAHAKERLRASGRPLYAVLFHFEAEDPRWAERPAVWEKIAEVDDVGIWRFVPDAPEEQAAPPRF